MRIKEYLPTIVILMILVLSLSLFVVDTVIIKILLIIFSTISGFISMKNAINIRNEIAKHTSISNPTPHMFDPFARLNEELKKKSR